MNRTLAAFVFAAASLGATASFAENLNNPAFPADTAQGTQVSRAEVQADLAQARADGSLLSAGDNTAYPVIQARSTLSREQVQAETRSTSRASYASLSTHREMPL